MHWLGPYVVKEVTDRGAVHLVKRNGEPFPGKVNGSYLKPYTGGPTISLSSGSTIFVLEGSRQRHMTINK